MFNKILIANRGEIAIRIIRACRELGVKTVAVYSTADKTALHAQIADEAVCIGPAPSKDSYLNSKALLAACEITGAQAIHPGFGFLSENSHFVRLCDKCGIKFIGPGADAMDAMGDKANAKKTMIENNVPVVPGSDGVVGTLEEAQEIAAKIGYPIMVKASAGGGGRGIRLVEKPEELEAAMTAAKQEAKQFFANDDIYIEKFIVNPRHVEIQLLADEHGNVIYLGERDCSLQRRNQKVLEESPSPIMTEDLRRRMGEAAVRAAKACGYANAGTVEFLVDKDLNFYFMEMNTRVQVEHPVSEQITGTDIIKEQLRIAAGEPMSCADRAPFTPFGHAMEFRINAEDPDHGFRPCPGKITRFEPPMGPGVRVETYVHEGSSISPYYDSMVAKVIVSGQDREECLARGRRALDEFKIEGIATTLPFHRRVLDNEVFRAGEATTDFIETQMGDLL